MTAETRKDMKFYVTLCMGFTIILIGIFLPPINVIPTSVLWASAMFLILAAGVIGMDVPAVIREVRMLKNEVINNIKDNNNKCIQEQQ